MTERNNSIERVAHDAKYELRVLDETWNERLLEINQKAPIKAGRLKIHFDRSPDIFAIPQLTSYKYRCLGLFKGAELHGYAIATYQHRYINGELEKVLYLGNVHVLHKGQGQVLLQLLSDRFLRVIPQGTGVRYFYAYIMERNQPALHLVDKGFLETRRNGRITMNLIFFTHPVRPGHNYQIRSAQQGEEQIIADILEEHHKRRLLAPEMNRQRFSELIQERPDFSIHNYYVALHQQEIVGVCGVWDMGHLKTTQLVDYAGSMAVWRAIYNIVGSMVGASKLPAKGEAFRELTVTEYGAKEDHPRILEALLRYVYNQFKRQGYHFIVVGSSPQDPLDQALRIFKIRQQLRSRVIIGSMYASDLEVLPTAPMSFADTIQI